MADCRNVDPSIVAPHQPGVIALWGRQYICEFPPSRIPPMKYRPAGSVTGDVRAMSNWPRVAMDVAGPCATNAPGRPTAVEAYRQGRNVVPATDVVTCMWNWSNCAPHGIGNGETFSPVPGLLPVIGWMPVR